MLFRPRKGTPLRMGGFALAGFGLLILLAAAYWLFFPRAPQAVLRVGYAVEAPYAFIDSNGKVSGEAPEVARAVAQQLGIELQWLLLPFNELLPALGKGHIDMIAAGMYITPERQRQAVFSHPTLRVQAGFLVKAGNLLRICRMEDLLSRGRVAVIEGAVEGRRLRVLGVPNASILATPDLNAALAALQAGLADTLALSLPSLRWAVNRSGLQGLEIAGCGAGGEQSADHTALAFRPKDAALRDRWNAALSLYLGGPSHRALLTGLGFTPADLDEMLPQQRRDGKP